MPAPFCKIPSGCEITSYKAVTDDEGRLTGPLTEFWLQLTSNYRLCRRLMIRQREALEKQVLFFPSPPQCTYADVIQFLCRKDLSSKPSKLTFKTSAICSGGSLASLDLVCDGRSIQAAIVQFDALASSSELCRQQVKIVAPLYEETMLFFLNHKHGSGSLSSIGALTRKRNQKLVIACLAKESSQSYRNLQTILEHHGFHDQVDIIACDYEEAGSKLQKGLVDGVFIVGSPHQKVIRKLAENPLYLLHSLDDREGLMERFHGLTLKKIPPKTLGVRQTREVQTLATEALLVISDRVSEAKAKALYRWLINHRQDLKQHLPVLDIRPPSEAMREWLHSGVERWLYHTVTFKDLLPILGLLVPVAIAVVTKWSKIFGPEAP